MERYKRGALWLGIVWLATGAVGYFILGASMEGVRWAFYMALSCGVFWLTLDLLGG